MEFQQKLEEILQDFEKRVSRILMKMDSKGGKIVESQAEILLRSKEIKDALKEAGYYNLTNEFLKKNEKIINERKKELEKYTRIGSIDKNAIKDLTKTHLIGMEEIGRHTAESIRNAILQGTLAGTNKTKLIETIRSEIGKMSRYAETYYNTAKTQYRQTAEDILAEEIGFGQRKNEMWEYVGAPLQKNSHPECIWALSQRKNPYFTTKEKEDFEAGVGAFPHPIPRWNCQHYFIMVYIEKPKIDTETKKDFVRFTKENNIKVRGAKGYDKERLDKIGATLSQLKEKYGVMYDNIQFLRNRRYIALNNIKYSGETGNIIDTTMRINKGYSDMMIALGEKNGWSIGKSIQDAVIHEYGHLLTITKYRHNTKLKNKLYDLFRNYLDEIKIHPEFVISKYSETSFDEFLAEAFADYHISKAPKKHSKLLMEIMEEVL